MTDMPNEHTEGLPHYEVRACLTFERWARCAITSRWALLDPAHSSGQTVGIPLLRIEQLSTLNTISHTCVFSTYALANP